MEDGVEAYCGAFEDGANNGGVKSGQWEIMADKYSCHGVTPQDEAKYNQVMMLHNMTEIKQTKNNHSNLLQSNNCQRNSHLTTVHDQQNLA